MCMVCVVLPCNPTAKSHAHARLIYFMKPSNLHVDLLPNLGRLPDRLSNGCSLQTTNSVDTFHLTSSSTSLPATSPPLRANQPNKRSTTHSVPLVTSLQDSGSTRMSSLRLRPPPSGTHSLPLGRQSRTLLDRSPRPSLRTIPAITMLNEQLQLASDQRQVVGLSEE